MTSVGDAITNVSYNTTLPGLGFARFLVLCGKLQPTSAHVEEKVVYPQKLWRREDIVLSNVRQVLRRKPSMELMSAPASSAPAEMRVM